MEAKEISGEEAHKIRSNMVWTIIDNKVYDITNYINMHPGGKRNILKGQFKDASKEFHASHKGLDINKTPLVLLEIGELKVNRDRTKTSEPAKKLTKESTPFSNEEIWLKNSQSDKDKLSISFGLL